MRNVLRRFFTALCVLTLLLCAGCSARSAPVPVARGEESVLTEPLGVSVSREGTAAFFRRQDDGFQEAPIKLFMRMPPGGSCSLLNVLYDEISGRYAVLYAVPGEGLTRLQLFGGEGEFLWDNETGARAPDGGASAYAEAFFHNGIVVFQDPPGESPQRCFADTANGQIQRVPSERLCRGEEEDPYLLFGVRWDESEKEEIGVMSLIREEMVAGSVTFSVDRSFSMPDNRFYEGEQREVFSLDARKLTAVLGNDKMDYLVDFNFGTVETVYHYTREHLHERLLTSADGLKAVYRADGGKAGGRSWADLVAEDAATGALSFLTDRYPRSLCFGPGHLLAAENGDSLSFYDTDSARPADFSLPFDYGAQGGGETALITLGIAYDAGGRFLLAYCERGEDPDALYPVLLDVYDARGTPAEKIKTVETHWSVPALAENQILRVGIEPDAAGRARLYAPDRIEYETTVAYLE